MEELVFKSEKGTPVTNSLLVAQKFGKEHKHVLDSIRELLQSAENQVAEFSATCKSMFYETTYIDANKIIRPLFVMNEDGFSLLAMGFTGSKALSFKLDFLKAFRKMREIIMSGGFQIPQSYSEALRLAAMQAEQIELQQKELKAAAPKVDYFDSVLQSNSTYTTTQIAKELGMTVCSLEKRLHEKKVIFRQSGQWLLYAGYDNKGYSKPRTHHYTKSDGSTGTNTITVWTELGRKFIHEL